MAGRAAQGHHHWPAGGTAAHAAALLSKDSAALSHPSSVRLAPPCAPLPHPLPARPQVSSFSSTLKGLPTIRAYGAQQRFHDSFLASLSVNGSWWYAFVTLGRWVGLRLDLVASTTLAAGALLAMGLRSSIKPELIGLALSYVLQVGWHARTHPPSCQCSCLRSLLACMLMALCMQRTKH